MEKLITQTINQNVQFTWAPTDDNIEKIKQYLDSTGNTKPIPKEKIKQIIEKENYKYPKSPSTKHGGSKKKYKRLKNKKYKKLKTKRKNKTKRKKSKHKLKINY